LVLTNLFYVQAQVEHIYYFPFHIHRHFKLKLMYKKHHMLLILFEY